MAFLLTWLQTGAGSTGIDLNGAAIINSLVNTGDFVGNGSDKAKLILIAQQSFQKVYWMAAGIATVSIFLTLLLKNESLSDKAPTTA